MVKFSENSNFSFTVDEHCNNDRQLFPRQKKRQSDQPLLGEPKPLKRRDLAASFRNTDGPTPFFHSARKCFAMIRSADGNELGCSFRKPHQLS
jgi:hypothetical protein